MKKASLLLMVVLLSLPVLAYAKSHAQKILRAPEAREVGNSQTMDLLEGYLNINPVGIGGGTLAIVDRTALASGDDASAFVDLGRSGTGEISVYTVRDGDTLSGIADMFGVSINTIIWANDLKTRTIKIGQELVILPISGVRHTVKRGDTLQTLAKQYKSELDEILSYNNLSTDATIVVGDIIIIPDGVMPASAQTSVARPASQTNVSAGYYMRPIAGGRKSQGIHGYNGVDIAAPVGTPIVASASGRVIIARPSGYNGGYGLYVVISHANGTQTLYGHMSRVNVTVGQNVTQGQVIGAVGNTGRSTGPHIHFEVRGARNPF
jgi:murein DD-endopeptidase MepM/ murein hydrolase activator NlpD